MGLLRDIVGCLTPDFWRPFDRSLTRALLHLVLVVSWLELVNLATFASDHRAEFGQFSAGTMLRSTVNAWPPKLIVRFGSEEPFLSLNQHLPLRVPLPSWIPTALALLLAHSARDELPAEEVLELLPDGVLAVERTREDVEDHDLDHALLSLSLEEGSLWVWGVEVPLP